MIKVVLVITIAACSAFILACFIVGFWKLVASEKKRKKADIDKEEIDRLLSLDESEIYRF